MPNSCIRGYHKFKSKKLIRSLIRAFVACFFLLVITPTLAAEGLIHSFAVVYFPLGETEGASTPAQKESSLPDKPWEIDHKLFFLPSHHRHHNRH